MTIPPMREENTVNRPQALALFDFDGTLIRGDSIVAFVRFARKKGAMSPREYLMACAAAVRYGLGLLSAAESKNAALAFRMRLSEKDRRALDEAFVRQELLGRVYPAGKACILSHRQAGRLPVLVTASTENYMPLAAQALGFEAVLCTPLLPDGTVGENCRGEEKPRRVLSWLKQQGVQADFAASWAYGDSKSDLPMLRLCGHPVQVNPKRKLKKAAPDMETAIWRA